jgi:hypothetical protein
MPFLAEYFERAALKLENIESIYGGICFLSPCLEDISELVLNSNAIQSHTIRISELIGRAKGVIQSSLIRLAVDILVFASLVPCHLISAPQQYYSIFPYKTAFSRSSIRPLSILLAEGLLQDLQGALTYNDYGEAVIHLKDLPLLGHIDIQAYMAGDLIQRMFWLSLAHLSLPLRQDLLISEEHTQTLSRRIYNSPFLSYWMLACSDAEEQFFLNTCDTAASLSSIVSFHSTIASLIHLGRLISSDVERRMSMASDSSPAYPVWWGSAPSQRSFSQALLDEFNREMASLESQISSILDAEQQTFPSSSKVLSTSSSHLAEVRAGPSVFEEGVLQERRKLVTKWHKAMQKLSSVFFPENPIILTEKVFQNDWHRSAKWMTAKGMFEQFLPSRPSLLSRAPASRTLEQISCHYHHTSLALMDPDADEGVWIEFPYNLSDALEYSKKMDFALKLWLRIAYHDGILVSSREHLFFGYWIIGHLSYWKAVKLGTKENDRYFLISDPELHYFKVLSIDQVVNYVSDIKNFVNPTDGAVVQHFRAARLGK